MTTFITQIHMVNAEETEDTPTEEVVQETKEVQEIQDVPQTTENLDEYYKDGKILIYNYEQLKQIGSDAFVYTKDKDGNIGTGDIVVNEGAQLTYGKDAQYLLMNEIKMDTKSIWNVKDDFTGKIEGEAIKEDETPTLYDKKTDKFIGELENEDYLTYVTESGDYLITEYINTSGERYGLLLNDKLEMVACLPGLCDVIGNELVFDYPSGNLRHCRLYSFQELIALGDTYITK